MVELRHLSYFRAVAELGSIAKAAVALDVTQPSLSRQIAQLERRLGYQLFRRSARGTVLTPAGQGLYDHLDVLFTQVDRIPDVLRAFDEMEHLLHFGIPGGMPYGWLEEFQRELARTAPNVALSVYEATSAEQRRLLRDGAIDIGLLHMAPPEVHSCLILEQRFGAAVRKDSPLADRRSVGFADLTGLRLMAHSTQETPGLEARLRSAAESDGVLVDWIFRRFSEYGELVADTAHADAALVAEASAARHFASWTWIPLDEASGLTAPIHTWAAWTDPDLEDLEACLSAMSYASRSSGIGAARKRKSSASSA